MFKSIFLGGVVFSLLSFQAHAVQFKATYKDNEKGDFAARGWLMPGSLFQKNVTAALAIWGKVIRSDVTLNVIIEASRTVSRAGGTFSVTDQKLYSPVCPAPLHVVRSGQNNPTIPYEIFLYIDAAYFDKNYWLDPTPINRSDEFPPDDKTDFVSIILHETGHGLGVAGYRETAVGEDYGKLTGEETMIDQLSHFTPENQPLNSKAEPNPLFFHGQSAKEIYGGPVPLSHVGPDKSLHTQDYYHFGTCGDPKILTRSLMTGCAVPRGRDPRMTITPLDKTLFSDLGYPISSPKHTSAKRGQKLPDGYCE